MREVIEKGLGYVLVILFVATLLTVVWQVLGRYVLQSPSSATEEVARFLLIWIGMLSSAYTFARRMHVGIDLLASRLSKSARAKVGKGIWIMCAIFSLAVLVYGGGLLVSITATLGQTSAALGLPMWTVYLVIPISGLLMTYHALTFVFTSEPLHEADLLETAHD